MTVPWLSDEITEDDVEFRPLEAVCTTCHLTYNRHLPECPDHEGGPHAGA